MVERKLHALKCTRIGLEPLTARFEVQVLGEELSAPALRSQSIKKVPQQEPALKPLGSRFNLSARSSFGHENSALTAREEAEFSLLSDVAPRYLPT